MGIRPECLTPADDGRPALELRVDVVEPLGEQVVVYGTVAGTPVHSGAEEQDEILLLVEGARAPMTAIFAADPEPSPGDVLRLGVAPDRIHLFDLASGDAIPGSAG